MNSLFNDIYVVCLCQSRPSKIIGGGGGAPQQSLILQKCVLPLEKLLHSPLSWIVTQVNTKLTLHWARSTNILLQLSRVSKNIFL